MFKNVEKQISKIFKAMVDHLQKLSEAPVMDKRDTDSQSMPILQEVTFKMWIASFTRPTWETCELQYALCISHDM